METTMQDHTHPIFLLAGAPAVGKSTTSRALAARFPQSIHLPVDDFRTMVVSGLVLPSDLPSHDLLQQITLARTCAIHVAFTYCSVGFMVVIDLILRGQAANSSKGDKSGGIAPEMSLRRYW